MCVWVSLDDLADALVRKVATLAGDVPAQSPTVRCINMDLAHTRTDTLLVLDSMGARGLTGGQTVHIRGQVRPDAAQE